TSGVSASLFSLSSHSVRTDGEPPLPLEQCLRVVDLTSRVWPTPPPRPAQTRGAPGRPSAAARVLVTGATGFIGTHLIRRLLSENVPVRALVRRNSFHAGRLQGLDVEIVEADLTESAALRVATRGIKTVYHAGAATNNDWNDNSRTTIEGTTLLLEAALAHRVERFVLLSSLAVYDLGKDRRGVIREDAQLLENPKQNGAYAYSKIVVEGLAVAAHREHGLGVT